MVKKFSKSQFIIYTVVTIFTLLCFLPMLLALIISFTSEEAIMLNGYSYFPDSWSLEAYTIIFSTNANFITSYLVTIFVTVVGTTLSVMITAGAGYALANKSVHYRNNLAFFFFIPMVFSTGMVPWYLICRQIGLYNNIFALIIPSLLFSAFNLFLVRNFMNTLPESLRESAMIEGANDITIFYKIYLPLSVPIIATLVLFVGIGYWNDWWNAIMLVDNPDLYPIQFVMLQIRSQVNMLNQMSGMAGDFIIPPTESLKMAACMVTIGPIVALYPFLQKYFIKGLIVGAVKG